MADPSGSIEFKPGSIMALVSHNLRLTDEIEELKRIQDMGNGTEETARMMNALLAEHEKNMAILYREDGMEMLAKAITSQPPIVPAKVNTEWQNAPTSKRARKRTNSDEDEYPPLKATNQFNALQEENLGANKMDDDSAPPPPTFSQPKKFAGKIPPLVITKAINMKDFRKDLKERLLIEKLEIKNEAGNSVIKLNTVDDYRKVQQKLESEGIPFHTFMLNSDKCNRVVIKGLTTDYEADEIKEELEINKIPVIKVKPITRMRDGIATQLPIFYAETPRTDEGKKIWEIRYLFDHKINVKAYRGRPGPTQCFNCQRYGHTQSACHNEPRCVRCTEAHRSHDCPYKNKDEYSAKCVLCNGDHPACSELCPKRPGNLKHTRKHFENKKITVSNKNDTATSSNESDTLNHTYVPSAYRNSDILDIMITIDIKQQPLLQVENDLMSDHLPVLFTLYGLKHGLPPLKTNINWNKYRDIINNSVETATTLNTIEDIDTEINKLNNKIHFAMKNAHSATNQEKLTLPNFIRLKIREKNRLRKIAQRTNSPTDKSNFNRCARELKTMMMNYRSEAWENFVENLSHKDATVWKISKALRREENIIGPIKDNNSIYHNAEDIANTFAKDYEEQFTVNPFDHPNDINIFNHVQNFITNNIPGNSPLVTPNEVKNHIKDLNPRKAAGIVKRDYG
ncbi:Nucleic-acid-binding protein from transposon X-element, partial [Stegodyphus mimosarum]